jgi:hypothetical protein
VVNIPVTFS